MRFVTVGQGVECVVVAFEGGAEQPHLGLPSVLSDRDAVGVAVAHHELRQRVTPLGGAEVPVHCLGLVSLDVLSDRKPLAKLEAGLHVPCFGLGNQLL